MTQPGKIKLLIADDHEVLRSGVKTMLAGTEIKVVADAAILFSNTSCVREIRLPSPEPTPARTSARCLRVAGRD
jgi:hypothetical protein